MKDLEFLAEDRGLNHQRQLELKEFDRKANIDAMAYQALVGGNNEQIGVTE